MQNNFLKYNHVANNIEKNLFNFLISSLMNNDKLNQFSANTFVTKSYKQH